MSKLAKLILGIMIGVLVSMMTLAMTHVALNVLVSGASLSATVTMLMLLLGMLLGVVSVGLSYITAGKERMVLVILVGVGLAALVVMIGGYGNHSLMPVGIYGLALLSSLLIGWVTAVLGEPAAHDTGHSLRT